MKATQKDVLNYLKTDRSLTGGRNLYNQLPNKSLALQSSFARMRDTEANRSKLYYELAKAVGIPQRQLTITLNKPVRKSMELAAEDIEVNSETVEATPEEKLLAFDREKADFYESRDLAKELGLKPGRSKDTVYAALEAAKSDAIDKQLQEIPLEVKATIKLREQFPFLREAKCPDALKLLVNDLITAYENFKAAQPKLHALVSQEETKATVDIVLENYIKNKQAWAELEHYKETGNILGEHPLFERLAEKEKITALNGVGLAKEIKNLEINIGKNRKKGNTELVEKQEDLLAHAKDVLAKR